MKERDRAGADSRVIGVLQPGYLPWLGFFEQLWRCDVFVIYDDVQFEKGSWRNRNRIKTPQGSQWLTVPVLLKGKGFPLIHEVEINPSVAWQKKHIKTLQQCYAKAPFYENYSKKLFDIVDRPWRTLIDLDVALIRWIAEVLGIDTRTVLSSSLGIEGKNVERLIAVIRELKGKVFYEGASGKNYIDAEQFEKEGITVVFQDYRHPVYPQLYGNFASHLSVIDLLFNCGPESLNILTHSEEDNG
jgi:hypothetical protein